MLKMVVNLSKMTFSSFSRSIPFIAYIAKNLTKEVITKIIKMKEELKFIDIFKAIKNIVNEQKKPIDLLRAL